MTEEELGTVVGLACCPLAAIVIIGLAVWLIIRASKRAPNQPPAPAAAPLHLSVLALSFDGVFRAQVEQALAAPFIAADAVGQRVEFVARVARALLDLEPQWRDFGYGEKDLVQLADARTSFGSAVEDFRARAAGPGDGGALVVLTLIIATRTVLTGVSSLEERAQVRAILQNRLTVENATLLGAEVVWSPREGTLSEPAVRARFPEMALLR